MASPRPGRDAFRRARTALAALALISVGWLTLGPLLGARPPDGAPAPGSDGGGTVVVAPVPSSTPSASRPDPVVASASPDSVASPRPAGVSSIPHRPPVPIGLSATVETRAALDARLVRLREKYDIPGISTTILFPDGTRWVGLAGYADLEDRTPVTLDTAFAIASISKTFTSALVLALVDEGRVALDDQVGEYLPGLDIDPKITVRQLLDHTSGLHDYFFHPRIDRALLADPDRRWTPVDALDYVGKPYFKPGRGWRYSNTNYLVLGLLTERVTGETIDDQLRERFLEPLGLDGTFYQPTETGRGPVAHGYRFGTGEAEERATDLTGKGPIVPFASVVTAAGGAGAIAAPSVDVARWARALYGGAVLSEASLQEMVDDMARTEPYGPSVPYGLGVQLVDMDGVPMLGHSGRLLGFRSVVRFDPESGLTIAVLTNQSRADPGVLARALLRVARQHAPASLSQEPR